MNSTSKGRYVTSWARGLTAVIGFMILTGVACGNSGTPSPSGPELGAIRGTVTDESGEPLPGIRVGIVSGTAAFPEIAPETDEKGLYQISGVSPGTFEVAFHDRKGNRVGIETVTVIGGETSTLDLQSSAAVSHGGPVTDYVSLVDNLRAAGATAEPAGTVSQPFFVPEGQLLTVNGERVETFEFANAEEANAVAKGVSASGSSISRVDSESGMGVAASVLWVAPPHFYKAGKLIVIYVGSDSGVISALQEAMGSQFAGR